MYRPQIKVVDCTIRDGGLANNSHFTLETVRAVYQAGLRGRRRLRRAGLPQQQEDVLARRSSARGGSATRSTLKQAVDGIDPRGTKISIMQDAHKADADDVPAQGQVAWWT